jgi:hypothetical protein
MMVPDERSGRIVANPSPTRYRSLPRSKGRPKSSLEKRWQRYAKIPYNHDSCHPDAQRKDLQLLFFVTARPSDEV